MPVVVTALFTPVEGKHGEVLEAISAVIPAVHREAGCELYAINTGGDGTLMMIERWTDADALDEHGRGEAVAELGRRLDGLLSERIDVRRWDPSPAGESPKGSV